MMRLISSLLCVIFLTVSSCSNSDSKTGEAVAGQEKQLRELIATYPDSILLKENLVQYFRDNGNYDRALNETDDVLQKDPANARFLNIKATLHFENGDTGRAISTFEKAISIDPKQEYVVSLGSLYAQTKNPMAVTLADALLQAPSANAGAQALFIKGLYYNYAGDKIKAIPYFDTCIRMDYRNMLAYREKAICLYDLNKYTNALDVLKQALTVQKSFEEGYYWMGRCYEKLDKRKEAIESYQAALQIDPDYIEAKEALGKIGK